MSTYDHTELRALVLELLDKHDREFLRDCIQKCHNGHLRGPINTDNLHLFRRYRNDPEGGSGNATDLINDAYKSLTK